MSAVECPRENDVLEVIAAGGWPHEAPAALRDHAATCAVCADLALAASALHDDAAAAVAAPVALPSAGQVWWRAQLRARNEKARLAQRPMIAVQVVAAVVVLAAAITAVRALLPDAWAWMAGNVTFRVSTADGLDTWTLLVIAFAGFWLLMIPVALFMVFRADREGGQ